MTERIGRTNNQCYMCRKPLEQPEKGRLRETCSDACRQKRYRWRQGKTDWNYKRKKKLIDQRRALPITEKSFDKHMFVPVHQLSYGRNVYECMACGTPYLVDRIKSGNAPRPYCSDVCEFRSRRRWKRFNEGLRKANALGKRVDKRVFERFDFGKFSPPCAHCGVPFAPNTAESGERLRGRPRKYCSAACGKAAYERRWKTRHGRSRVHRMHPCVECGTMFDRTDAQGRRFRRFCKPKCCYDFKSRAERARERFRRAGQEVFKRGSGGFGAAARGSLKNRQKRVLRIKVTRINSGGTDQRKWVMTTPDGWGGLWVGERIRMSAGVLGVWALCKGETATV